MIMKRIFQTGTNEEYLNLLVLVLRITLAAFMITHGGPKLSRLLDGGEIQFADPLGLGPALSLGLVVFAEFLKRRPQDVPENVLADIDRLSKVLAKGMDSSPEMGKPISKIIEKK